MTSFVPPWRRAAVALAAVACLALAATGCGSGGSSKSGSGSGGSGRTTVTLGVQPITPFAAIPLGVQHGLFAKHGLDVKVKIITTATTIPPGLLAGQLQFSDWSYASFTTLAERGLPLKIVGPGDVAGSTLDDDYTQLVASKKSGIASVKQLAGKTIAVNSLASLSEAQTRAALRAAGVDPGSVKLVPIPYPDQRAALAGGQVDAAQTAEPFLTQLKAAGEVTPLAPLDGAVMDGLPVSTWMTSAKYAQQHPDVVRAFQLGLRDSLQYAQDHPDAVRAFIPRFAGVDAATAQRMVLPRWVTDVPQSKIQAVADFMHAAGITQSTVQMTPYLLSWPPKG